MTITKKYWGDIDWLINRDFSDRRIATYYGVSIDTVQSHLPREKKVEILKAAGYNPTEALYHHIDPKIIVDMKVAEWYNENHG